MAASTSTSGALKSWIYPKGSGIRVREILNTHAGAAFGASYLVTVPAKITGRLRERKQFKTRIEAEQYCDDSFKGYKRQGHEFFALTDGERREVAVSMPLLRQAGISLTDAVQFALKRMRAEGRDKTVRHLVDELVQSKEQRFTRGDLRVRSYNDFKNRAERLASALGDRIAGEVTSQHLKDWLNEQKLGTRSNANYLAVAGELFKFAQQKRYVAFSPLDDLTDVDRKELCGGGNDESEPSILTPEQAESLLAGALAHPDLQLLPAVVLALFCGLRTEELKRVDWASVRIKDAHPIVTITAKVAKKRRIRNVDIPANAVEWLSTVTEREGPVAPNKHANDFQKRFQKLLRLAGFSKKNAHGEWKSAWENNAMRHSFGSYHYALHGNSLETARQMGHKASDQVLFDHYRALATKHQAESFFALTPPARADKLVAFK